MYRIWLLLTVALLWAVLGCNRPASSAEPAPSPGPFPAAPAQE